MKTAISLPDQVFDAADDLASRLHVSRSQLYVMALERFIKEHDQGSVTAKIDDYIEAYGQPVDVAVTDYSKRDLRKVPW